MKSPSSPRYRLGPVRPATALALALALTACAGSSDGNVAADAKSAVMLKVADDTRAGGDPAGALTIYRQLHETAPKDPVPLVRIGATAMELADYADAKTAYRAALAINPNDADSRRGLALVLLTEGHAEQAVTELEAALALNADDPRTYNGLGVAHDMMGRYEEAQKDYRNGLKLAPTNASLRNNLGMSFALAGNFEAAIATLDGLGGVADAPARFRLNLALAYGLAGNEEKAASVARHVLDEPSVKNNLEYYAMLRAMDAKSRAAAIVGAQLHGSAIASAAVRRTEVATSPPPAAAPQVAVRATPLPAPAAPTEIAAARPAPAPAAPTKIAAARPAPPASPSTDDIADLPTEVAAHDSAPAPADIAPRPKHPQVRAKAVATAPAKPAETAPQTAASMPDRNAAPADAPTADPVPPTAPATTASDAKPAGPVPAAATTASAPAEPASGPPVQAVPAPKQAAEAAPVEPAKPAVADGMVPASAPPATAPALAIAEETAPAATPADVAPVAATAAPETASPAAAAVSETAESQGRPAVAGASGDHFVLQLGSFVLESSARKVADQCAAKGFEVRIARSRDSSGREWFVVRSSDFASADDATAAIRKFHDVAGVAPRMVHHHGPTTAQAADTAPPAAVPASALQEPHADGDSAPTGSIDAEASARSLLSTPADGPGDGIVAAAFAPKAALAEPGAEASATGTAGPTSVALAEIAAAAAPRSEPKIILHRLLQPRTDTEHVVVQLGSYVLESSARTVMNECAARGIEVKLGRVHDREGRNWFTVRTGEFASSDEAAPVLRQIGEINGVTPLVLKHRAPSA